MHVSLFVGVLGDRLDFVLELDDSCILFMIQSSLYLFPWQKLPLFVSKNIVNPY